MVQRASWVCWLVFPFISTPISGSHLPTLHEIISIGQTDAHEVIFRLTYSLCRACWSFDSLELGAQKSSTPACLILSVASLVPKTYLLGYKISLRHFKLAGVNWYGASDSYHVVPCQQDGSIQLIGDFAGLESCRRFYRTTVWWKPLALTQNHRPGWWPWCSSTFSCLDLMVINGVVETYLEPLESCKHWAFRQRCFLGGEGGYLVASYL